MSMRAHVAALAGSPTRAGYTHRVCGQRLAAAWTDLVDIFDPEGQMWWTAFGLILFASLSRLATGLTPKVPLKISAGELRYWLAVYRGLRRMAESRGEKTCARR